MSQRSEAAGQENASPRSETIPEVNRQRRGRDDAALSIEVQLHAGDLG